LNKQLTLAASDFAHVTAIRCDGVNPDLLGMNRIVSEDALRRALKAIDKDTGVAWLDKHLRESTRVLLDAPWVLDIDTTLEPLYGRQQGAVVSYNPHKPGRPSHAYHTYLMAGTRLVLGIDVKAGNEHSANHSLPGLLHLLDGMTPEQRPRIVRGDCAFGSDLVMRTLEERGQPYLFKLRLSKNVKRHIERMFEHEGWTDAGQGWEGLDGSLSLMGWEGARRVVLIRRALAGEVALQYTDDRQQVLGFVEVDPKAGKRIRGYEYAVLVTNLDYEVLTLGQLYRDRADAENSFDELKNQWGWGGFTTHDLVDDAPLAGRITPLEHHDHLQALLLDPFLQLDQLDVQPLQFFLVHFRFHLRTRCAVGGGADLARHDAGWRLPVLVFLVLRHGTGSDEGACVEVRLARKYSRQPPAKHLRRPMSGTHAPSSWGAARAKSQPSLRD